MVTNLFHKPVKQPCNVASSVVQSNPSPTGDTDLSGSCDITQWSADLVLGLDMPSSTQQMCVISSPTFTTQAELSPAQYVAHTDSCRHTGICRSGLTLHVSPSLPPSLLTDRPTDRPTNWPTKGMGEVGRGTCTCIYIPGVKWQLQTPFWRGHWSFPSWPVGPTGLEPVRLPGSSVEEWTSQECKLVKQISTLKNWANFICKKSN